ncbi:uncharacterized protein [Littorina saxatilis]|uniref:uncharacterized protein n=1 Tax=Littorina saxatilis TaxID=31220 RepID=UPI0038B4303D
MAGGPSRALSHWSATLHSQWIVGVVGSGFRLLWQDKKAPLSRRPPACKPPSSQEARSVLQAEIVTLVQKGAVEKVLDHSSPGFYGRLFAVPKSSGGWRPVLDLSQLNTFLRTIRFKMETPASTNMMGVKGGPKLLQSKGHSLELQQVDVPVALLCRPQARRSLSVCVRSPPRQRRICEGLDSPRDRAERHSQISERLRRNQFRLCCVDRKAQQVGLTKNRLGMTRATCPALPLLRASLRTLASILGQMESMALLVPLGRVHKRPLQLALKPYVDSAHVDWNVLVPLQGWFQSATLPWLDSDWVCRGVPIALPPPDTDLFTDASLSGWGAHTDRQTASGLWSAEQSHWHINLLELEAVALALEEFRPSLHAHHVRLFTDNTTVAAYLNKQGGSRSPSLSRRTCEILVWCWHHQITLTARYLPGSLNTLADALSRSDKVIQSEWTITQGALLRLWALVPKPLVDLFATRFSKRLSIFVSPFPDPEAWQTDALAFPWTGLQAYAFPPFQLLSRVLRKAEMEGPDLLLVAPLWPSQVWFPDLLRLAHGPPVPLFLTKGELVQPHTGIPHEDPSSLNLHVWRLSGPF